MLGIELIVKERQEQIEKHGRTILEDAVANNEGQLMDAIFLIIASFSEHPLDPEFIKPKGWDIEIWKHILAKDKIDRLAVLGAFAAAEIDRENYLETLKEN